MLRTAKYSIGKVLEKKTLFEYSYIQADASHPTTDPVKKVKVASRLSHHVWYAEDGKIPGPKKVTLQTQNLIQKDFLSLHKYRQEKNCGLEVGPR